MPPKRTAQSRPVTPYEDDGDDMLSQHSKAPDSDDRELEYVQPLDLPLRTDLTTCTTYTSDDIRRVYAKAVAEFKVSWQKQKREKETKLLQATRAELDGQFSGKQKEMEGIAKEMADVHQDFLRKYAIIEDKQREVVTKIIEAQKTLVSLSVKRHQEVIELGQEVEDGQLEGMNQVKQACNDFLGMRDALMVD
ncbi:hypothetical protein BU15DRAFT_75317 [Melanogaster broomeanus]|nr:hypothetical protein BU15DRAFT_75317 [Melanogaster broomeanus]